MIKTLSKYIRNKHKKEEEKYNPVIPSRFVDYCEDQDEGIPAGLFHTQEHTFRFYFTKYPHLQHITKFLKDPLKSKYSSQYFKISFNPIQEKLFHRLYSGVSSFDNDWFYQNDEYIKGLSLRHKFALVAMTNKSQQHVQSYLKGTINNEFRDRIRHWKNDIYGYMPIFFQILDECLNTRKFVQWRQMENKNQKLKKDYQYIVKHICPALTDRDIDKYIQDLYKEVKAIFSKCPKTTKPMVMCRGIRSSSTTEKTISSHRGFTSLSLNPHHALKYTGSVCCLQKIKILPGTRLLFIGGLSSFKKEMECLLPDNIKFYQVKQSCEIILKNNKLKTKCPESNDTRRITIQELVVL